MYLANKMTNESIVQIGKKLGGRNHATIIHAINTISNLEATDNQTKQDLAKLKELINAK